jgi:hypothetical protein
MKPDLIPDGNLPRVYVGRGQDQVTWRMEGENEAARVTWSN